MRHELNFLLQFFFFFPLSTFLCDFQSLIEYETVKMLSGALLSLVQYTSQLEIFVEYLCAKVNSKDQ